MNTKLQGFTVTDNSQTNDIYIINYDPAKISIGDSTEVYFKFGLLGYKKGDTFKATVKISYLNDDQDSGYSFDLDINNVPVDDQGALNIDKRLFSCKFFFTQPIIVKDNIVKCQMVLQHNGEKVGKENCYFAFKPEK